jgi:Tol biopolymer transport system component
MHAILKDEPPDLLETNRNLLPGLERIVRHCLEKRPEQRFHSAHDVAFDLQAVSGASETNATLVPRRGVNWTSLLATAAALAAGIALGALAVLTLRKAAPAEPPTYRRLTFDRGTLGAARFAPDGNTVVYNAAWRGAPTEVFTTRLDSRESRPLGLHGAALHAISSTGELAVGLDAVGAAFNSKGTLARVPLAGGAPREVLAGVTWADWSRDGTELAVVQRARDTYRVEFPIGRVLYETKDEVTHLRTSPRGDWLAFAEHPAGLLTTSAGSVVVMDRKGLRRVLSTDWVDLFGVAWRPDGLEVWFTATRRSGDFKALHGVTLDGKERLVARTLGQLDLLDVGAGGRVLVNHPTLGLEMVALGRGASRERDITWLGNSWPQGVSESGDLVLFTELAEGGAEGGFVYLRKTDGSPAVRLGDGEALALSPDGKWALARRSLSQIALLPTGVGEARSVPGQGFTYLDGGFFPDGRRLVFIARSADGVRSYEQALDGGEPKAISPAGTSGKLVSPDARTLLAQGPDGFVLLPIEGGEPHKCTVLQSEDEPIRWSSEGLAIFVARSQSVTTQVFRVELASGRRTLLWELGARDPAGAGWPGVSLTADGKAYAYAFPRNLGDLYLVDGLK